MKIEILVRVFWANFSRIESSRIALKKPFLKNIDEKIYLGPLLEPTEGNHSSKNEK